MSPDDAWMINAECTKLPLDKADKIFFPPKRKGIRSDPTRAKEICSVCPVRVHCFMFAIAHKIPYGVWGGRTDGERAVIPKYIKVQIRRAWKEGTLIDPEKWEEVI